MLMARRAGPREILEMPGYRKCSIDASASDERICDGAARDADLEQELDHWLTKSLVQAAALPPKKRNRCGLDSGKRNQPYEGRDFSLRALSSVIAQIFFGSPSRPCRNCRP